MNRYEQEVCVFLCRNGNNGDKKKKKKNVRKKFKPLPLSHLEWV